MPPRDEGGRAAGTPCFVIGVCSFCGNALAHTQCPGFAFPDLLWPLRLDSPAFSWNKPYRPQTGAGISHDHGGVVHRSLPSGISSDGIVAATFSATVIVISRRSVSPPVPVSGTRCCGDAADGQVWHQGESCGVGCMNLA